MISTQAVITDADLLRVYGASEKELVHAPSGLKHVHALRAIAEYGAAMTREPARPRLVSLTHPTHNGEYAFSEAVWDDGTVMQKTRKNGWTVVQRIPTPEDPCPKT